MRKNIVGPSKGKRPLGITRRIWDEDIQRYLRKIRMETVDQDMDFILVNSLTNLWFP